MSRGSAVYGKLLHCYPAPFRREYGHQMQLMFAEQLREARRAGPRQEAALWAEAAFDVITIAPKEHWHVLREDLRYAARTTTARPAFALVAILSLALGIGANIAIFSLWHSTQRAALPGVDDPDRLVILTNPAASGMWRGGWSHRTDGPRAWLTYAEFEQLRERIAGVSSLMASQASLAFWQVRLDGGAAEDVRGRLVSNGFFETLGVRPAIGRFFLSARTGDASPEVVISHAFWQRRFEGRADVLGRELAIQSARLTIVGVASPGFIGETSSQRPDLWLPLHLQPEVIPFTNWLQERPPEKVMWLHVFGRLRPGVTAAQVDSQANTAFRAGLESFYGPGETPGRRDALEQRLRVQPAARGASPVRAQLSSSLRVLLAGVGILLLIACANLANLLLARGASRETEIAVRVSLGASRTRLVRQFVTESLVLAIAGGVAAVGVAFVLHGILVRMLQEAEPRFFISFTFDLPMLACALVSTFAAAVAFGALPAWQTTRSDCGSHLKSQGRGTAGSSRELRSGRWLVALQLALSLPLLVGAGLLTRTVLSLQHVELGFRAERMVTARVNLGALVQDVPRRDATLRAIQQPLLQIPGIEAASFSQLGLFGGGASTSTIEVDDRPSPPGQEIESALDRVGAGYFTTLGIPLKWGRDIAESDSATSPKVCVVNDAFVRRHFGGRIPAGRTVYTSDDGARTPYAIVGVAGDARMRDLRDDIEPRFYVPAEQLPSLGSTRTFLIRTAQGPNAVIAAVRSAITGIDAELSVPMAASVADQLAPLTAEDRIIARLALVFGSVALALAAIGLYGVLSYGVARRSSEMAIRIALGAQNRDVIALILREGTAVVIAGLTAGAGVAWLATRLIASRLHGVDPQDPVTLMLAAGVLLAVSLLASFLPARRASRLDPIRALHQS